MIEFSNLSEDRFKTYYGNLIEQYQYVEFHLEGIYARCCEEGFLKGLEIVEKHNINALLNDLARIQKERNVSILLDDEIVRIREMCKSRNYWVHECFTDLNGNDIKFQDKTGNPDQRSVDRLREDLREAEEIAGILHERYLALKNGNI